MVGQKKADFERPSNRKRKEEQKLKKLSPEPLKVALRPSGVITCFPNTMKELLPQCCPSVKVALGSYHSANVLGILDNFHFPKNSSQFVDTQSNSSWADIATILYPTALPMVEVEPSNPVSYHKSLETGQQRSERRSHHCKIISVCTR